MGSGAPSVLLTVLSAFCALSPLVLTTPHQEGLLIPVFRQGSWGVVQISVLPKVTQLGSGRGSVGPSLPLNPVPLRYERDRKPCRTS